MSIALLCSGHALVVAGVSGFHVSVDGGIEGEHALHSGGGVGRGSRRRLRQWRQRVFRFQTHQGAIVRNGGGRRNTQNRGRIAWGMVVVVVAVVVVIVVIVSSFYPLYLTSEHGGVMPKHPTCQYCVFWGSLCPPGMVPSSEAENRSNLAS